MRKKRKKDWIKIGRKGRRERRRKERQKGNREEGKGEKK